MSRPGESEPPMGQHGRRPDITALQKGGQIGHREVEVSRADLIRYAAASGDHNPIHWNERFAREVGLDGVIAHGMLTMGLAVDVVSEWAGDPGAVVDYQARFTKPVPVPDVHHGSPLTPTARLSVTGTVGAITLGEPGPTGDQGVEAGATSSGTVRIDLTVTFIGPDGESVKVLAKSQAVVAL